MKTTNHQAFKLSIDDDGPWYAPRVQDGFWYGPPESYRAYEWKFAGTTRVSQLIPAGQIQAKYRLDDRREQRRLLNDFMTIRSAQDAGDWMDEYGLPGKPDMFSDHPGIMPFKLILAAESLRGLKKVGDAWRNSQSEKLLSLLREETLEEDEVILRFALRVDGTPFKERLFPWYSNFSETCKEEIVFDRSEDEDDTAEPTGELRGYRLRDYIKDVLTEDRLARNSLDSANKKTTAKRKRSSKQLTAKEKAIADQRKELARYLNAILDQSYYSFQGAQTAYLCSRYSGMASEMIAPIPVDSSAWAEEDKRPLMVLEMAEAYLVNALNIMLSDIQPVVTMQHGLRFRYRLEFPWHAIATAFAERILDKRMVIRFCEVNNCGREISHKREGAKRCDRHANP